MNPSSMAACIIITAPRNEQDSRHLLQPCKYNSIPQSSASSSSSSLPSTVSDNTAGYISSSLDPPNYDDPSHPWMADQDQQDEEEEFLPPYQCTVSHAGKVYVKKERESPHAMSKRRSWNKLHVVLSGTQLRAYKHRPRRPKGNEKPLWCHSMQDVQVGLATDYRKFPCVVRIKIRDGPQFLMRCCTHGNAMLWIDTIQASALISTDLDTRSMPVFSFDRRRRSRLALSS